MPPRELESAPTPKYTWKQYKEHSKESRAAIRNSLTQNFSKATIAKGTGAFKIYALGNSPNSSNQTLLHTEVPLAHLNKVLESDGPIHPIELQLKPVFLQDPFRVSTPSAEFSLLCERQRSNIVHGITDFNVTNGNILLLAGDQIYKYSPRVDHLISLNIGGQRFNDFCERFAAREQISEYRMHGCSAESPPPVQSGMTSNGYSNPLTTPPAFPASNFVSEARICPIDETLIAYVLNKQVYIEKSGRLIYRTTSKSKFVSNGVPSFICQEELERFEGIWWSAKEKRLLYEQVDESIVEDACFQINGRAPQTPMKYPRAGTKNAMSTLRMLIIEENTVYDSALIVDFRTKFPPFEYITRAGFWSDGKTVYAQLMSRRQTDCVLMLIPEWDFELPDHLKPPPSKIEAIGDGYPGLLPEDYDYDISGKEFASPYGEILAAENVHLVKSDSWLNVNNAIHPMEMAPGPGPLYNFTYCQETDLGATLILASAHVNKRGKCFHVDEILLMPEDKSICKSIQVEVDEKRKLAYFVANDTDPTEWNVCVSAYDLDPRSSKAQYKVLTERGLSFRPERANSVLSIDFDVGFTCWITAIDKPPVCRFYALKFSEGQLLPEAHFVAFITLPSSGPYERIEGTGPERIAFRSANSGFLHYAMIMKPPNFDKTKKYPVLQYVYGGPGIQLVHNDYCSWVPFVKYTRLGYIVIMIDNRGSANRGMAFEKPILGKLGAIEVEDQVEGLQYLAHASGGYMDLSRVVVHGWSYGGYMALLMMATYPKLYRGAIAGGAVVDWTLYDTAYTERYMGWPINPSLYQESSVLKVVDHLPEEPDRVMLIHGVMDENVHFSHYCALVDACIRKGKNPELLIFPHERHGIRNADSAAYMDAKIMLFMQKALNTEAHHDDW